MQNEQSYIESVKLLRKEELAEISKEFENNIDKI
jgi:hypothetical protein